MLVTMGVPLTFVLPQVWQKHHGVGPAPDAARQRAAQLYPAIAPQLARKRDEHRADALLLAAFGLHRLLHGEQQCPGIGLEIDPTYAETAVRRLSKNAVP